MEILREREKGFYFIILTPITSDDDTMTKLKNVDAVSSHNNKI